MCNVGGFDTPLVDDFDTIEYALLFMLGDIHAVLVWDDILIAPVHLTDV